jgi:hypothetical protein
MLETSNFVLRSIKKVHFNSLSFQAEIRGCENCGSAHVIIFQFEMLRGQKLLLNSIFLQVSKLEKIL